MSFLLQHQQKYRLLKLFLCCTVCCVCLFDTADAASTSTRTRRQQQQLWRAGRPRFGLLPAPEITTNDNNNNNKNNETTTVVDDNEKKEETTTVVVDDMTNPERADRSSCNTAPIEGTAAHADKTKTTTTTTTTTAVTTTDNNSHFDNRRGVFPRLRWLSTLLENNNPTAIEEKTTATTKSNVREQEDERRQADQDYSPMLSSSKNETTVYSSSTTTNNGTATVRPLVIQRRRFWPISSSTDNDGISSEEKETATTTAAQNTTIDTSTPTPISHSVNDNEESTTAIMEGRQRQTTTRTRWNKRWFSGERQGKIDTYSSDGRMKKDDDNNTEEETNAEVQTITTAEVNEDVVESSLNTDQTTTPPSSLDKLESSSTLLFPKVQPPSLNVLRRIRKRFDQQTMIQVEDDDDDDDVQQDALSAQDYHNNDVKEEEESLVEQQQRQLPTRTTSSKGKVSRRQVSNDDEVNVNETDVNDERETTSQLLHPSLRTRLEESLTNVKSLFQQIPSSEQIDEDDIGRRPASSMMNEQNQTEDEPTVDTVFIQGETTIQSLPTTNKTQVLDEQTVGPTKRGGPTFQRLKQSLAGAVTFLRGLVPEQSSGTIAVNATIDTSSTPASSIQQTNVTQMTAYSSPNKSSNPITIIRNLPWTPKGATKYNLDTSHVPPPPIEVNPIQFIKGLPWTPRRQNGTERKAELEENNDEKQTVATQNDTERHGRESMTDAKDTVGSSEGTSTGTRRKEAPVVAVDEIQNGTLDQPEGVKAAGNENKGVAEQRNLKDEQAVVEEESSIMAMEVDDALSKYLSRQAEDSFVSDNGKGMEEETDVDDMIASQASPTARIVEKVDDTNGTNETNKNLNTSGKDSRSSERSIEENDADMGNANVLTLDSLVSHVMNSIEEQQKGIEARRTAKTDGAKDTSPSNATSRSQTSMRPDEELQEPSDSTTAENVTETSRTSTSENIDEASPDRHEDERRRWSPPPPQQQPTVIIMGGPQDGRSLPSDLSRRPAPTPSLLLVEAFVTLVGTAIRIWMVSLFARWWSEEETLRPVQHFVWEILNERYSRDASALQNVLQLPPTGVPDWKWRLYLRKQRRFEGKTPQRKQHLPQQTYARTAIVLDINEKMDIPHLEQAVTFILSQHRVQAFGSIGGLSKELEVILLVDSAGGAAQDFGLASAQVRRLAQEPGVITTACVDKVAASGGYMIASQADSILASRIAIVGSIGVMRENINIHDALERHGIIGTVLKAGDSKVPLTMLGSTTKKDLSIAQNTLDLLHAAFKELVVDGRPQLGENIDAVANGDVFFGENAVELLLIDRIVTSEEYLLERVQAGDRVMKLHKAHQFAVRRKLFHPLDLLPEKGSLSLRTLCANWFKSDVVSKVTQFATVTSAVGAVNFLSRHRFFFGGWHPPR